jgi:hypothetical protein
LRSVSSHPSRTNRSGTASEPRGACATVTISRSEQRAGDYRGLPSSSL